MTVRKGIPRLGKHRKEPDFGTKCPEAAGSVPKLEILSGKTATESKMEGTHAEELACIQEQLAKQFGILECTAYTAKLECAISKKDAEYCTKILSLLLASMEGKTDISSNILFKHLNLSDDNIENLPRQLLSSMIEQLKFELYDETSFLKENPEFQSLLRRYGEYLER